MFLMILSYIHPLYSVLIEFLPHDLTFSRKRVDYWNSALRDVFLAKCRVYGNAIGRAIEIDRIAEASIIKYCQ